MRLTKKQLMRLIKETFKPESEYQFLNNNLEFKQQISDLKTNAQGGRTVGLTQELSLKYYSENPGSTQNILYEKGRREIGGSNIGMDKLVYRPRYGDAIFIKLGRDPITGKPYGKSIKPLISLSEAGGNWTGNIYCIFGEYEDWESGKMLYGEIITQNPEIYNKVPASNKFVVDTGVYVDNVLWRRSGFARSRRINMPHVLSVLDKHLTEIYSYFNLIPETKSSSELVKTLINI
jgi:hypothetical protein